MDDTDGMDPTGDYLAAPDELIAAKLACRRRLGGALQAMGLTQLLPTEGQLAYLADELAIKINIAAVGSIFTRPTGALGRTQQCAVRKFCAAASN